MFVTSAGTCRRAPVPWAQEVLAAAVRLPYVLALRPGGLSVYSLLDHALKQTVALDGARGLASGPEGVLVFTDRQIWALSLVPLEEQIRALVSGRRLDEALSLLRGVQDHLRPRTYESHGDHVEAIKTWVKIADGHSEDHTCPNVYEHIVSTLTAQDTGVAWTFAEWALRKNQEVGVQIFTKHHQRNTFKAEEILTFLKDYPQASLLYLEFLIDQKSEAESHHTQLALAYVTQALQAFQREEELARAGETYRRKLQNLLWTSASYDVAAIHGMFTRQRIRATQLHAERAIVLGRAGDHAQALRVLVHEAQDPRAAQDYCHRASHAGGLPPPPPREEAGRLGETLLLALLDVYLSRGDHLAAEAAELLGANSRLFRAPGRVVALLPGAWSVGLVCRFLVGSLRETQHQRRMGTLQRALAQAECLRHKALWTQASKTMVRVPRGQVCGACQTELTESFLCTPSGELRHTSCRSNQEPPTHPPTR
ncbi:hypothetical protein CRUP_023811 [Coryphaenoides rupestris]|nr:hypothetical protein CRUP_023811 [Coryphaenoides rupestris]